MSASLPLADASGAISAIAALVVILLVVGGLIFLLGRSGRRAKREHEEALAAGHPTGTTSTEDGEEDVEPNLGAMGLAVAAALLAVVSVFLPALETSSFSSIAENTLIQSGGGWLVVGCAVGILGAVYRTHSGRRTTWAVFVLGLVILGTAIYQGTGDRTKLESVASLAGEKLTVEGSPAVGIYAAGVAGALAMFAGFILAGNPVSSYQGASRRTKVCPDCAETVLAAARKCKHCGHQFDDQPTQSAERRTSIP